MCAIFLSILTFNVFRLKERKCQTCSGLRICPHLPAFRVQETLRNSGYRSKLKDDCM